MISYRIVFGVEEHHDVLLALEGPQGYLSSILVLDGEVRGSGANLRAVQQFGTAQQGGEGGRWGLRYTPDYNI